MGEDRGGVGTPGVCMGRGRTGAAWAHRECAWDGGGQGRRGHTGSVHGTGEDSIRRGHTGSVHGTEEDRGGVGTPGVCMGRGRTGRRGHTGSVHGTEEDRGGVGTPVVCMGRGRIVCGVGTPVVCMGRGRTGAAWAHR